MQSNCLKELITYTSNWPFHGISHDRGYLSLCDKLSLNWKQMTNYETIGLIIISMGFKRWDVITDLHEELVCVSKSVDVILGRFPSSLAVSSFLAK